MTKTLVTLTTGCAAGCACPELCAQGGCASDCTCPGCASDGVGALIEERNLEGREVPEEFYRALLDEAAGREGLAYEVRVCQEGPATEEALGRVLVCAPTMAEALNLARAVASDYFQGVAVVDTLAEVIDWGGEVTDYEGYKRRLRLYWDDQAGVEPGWFCEVQGQREGEGWTVLDDSQKVGFPVDLDEFTEGQEDEAKAALLEAFPGASFR